MSAGVRAAAADAEAPPADEGEAPDPVDGEAPPVDGVGGAPFEQAPTRKMRDDPRECARRDRMSTPPNFGLPHWAQEGARVAGGSSRARLPGSVKIGRRRRHRQPR